jgi:hypothetical protein
MSKHLYRPVSAHGVRNTPSTLVPRPTETHENVKLGEAHKPNDIRPGGYETPYREPLYQDHGVDNDDWPDKTETGEEF